MISFRIKLLSEYCSPRSLLFLLWLFLFVFPKGGFKIGAVPITWGYLLLGFISFLLLFRKQFQLQTPRLQAFFFILPFQVVFLGSFLINGIENQPFAISMLLNFLFLPFVFFCLFSNSIETLDLNYFCRTLKSGIFFVSFYGIFLFFYKLLTGNLIEIPFLTVNYYDLGEMAAKCNNRGFVFKLISTYNNGNIYGICLLMFLSLYSLLEKRAWRRYLVKMSLFLTFSRTVWMGLILNQILYRFFCLEKRGAFWLKLIFEGVVLTLIYVGVSFFLGFQLDFLFDRNLGGRMGQLTFLRTSTFFPSKPFSGILEMVYLSILDQFGVLGLLTYLLAMGAPIFFSFIYNKFNSFQYALLCGLLTYLCISASDGALLFIPIMAFYWFCSSLFLCKFKAANMYTERD